MIFVFTHRYSGLVHSKLGVFTCNTPVLLDRQSSPLHSPTQPPRRDISSSRIHRSPRRRCRWYPRPQSVQTRMRVWVLKWHTVETRRVRSSIPRQPGVLQVMEVRVRSEVVEKGASGASWEEGVWGRSVQVRCQAGGGGVGAGRDA